MKEHLEELLVEYEDRIDKYLGHNSSFSRADIGKLIEGKAVYANDVEIRKPNFKVRPGDKIKITKIIQREINAEPENIDIDIVFEDDDLVVINKASGMVVHPAPGHHSGTLVNALLYHFKDLSDINGQIRPGIVHRIDKDTSGLLVVAKNNETHRALAELLKTHDIKRVYYALVEGKVENDTTHIKLPIGRDKNHRQRMAATNRNSKEATTHVYTEKIFEDRTFVRCELETGRTHQIRVHLSHIGHPVLGDALYGKRIDDFGQRLHAAKLEFVHPTTGEKVSFEAKLPKEFNV